MIGEITQAILNEWKAYLDNTGALIILKTNWKKLDGNVANNGTFVLMDIPDGVDSVQYPGGLTRMDWTINFNSYSYEPDAYTDDTSGYSTDLLNFTDGCRQHFELGNNAYGGVNVGETLVVGKIYKVFGTITYNSTVYTNGQMFTAISGVTSFIGSGYVQGTGWLTQAMADIFNTYGFQFTFTGITVADAIDQEGIIMGWKIGMVSTAFDDTTVFIAPSEYPLTSIVQVDNPPFDGSVVIS